MKIDRMRKTGGRKLCKKIPFGMKMEKNGKQSVNY